MRLTLLMGAALLAGPLDASAQARPPVEVVARFGGTWQLDPQRSDTLATDPLATVKPMGPLVLVPRDRVVSGGTRVMERTGPPPPPPTARRDPRLDPIHRDLVSGGSLTVAITDSSVTLVNADGATATWATDGRPHHDAQMDGTMIESRARWKGTALEVTRGVPGYAMLRREFRVSKDGATLTVRADLTGSYNWKVPGFPKEFVFTHP